MISKISKLQNKMRYFYISLFSYLSMNHGQNQFHVMRLDLSLMMRQKMWISLCSVKIHLDPYFQFIGNLFLLKEIL